MVSFHASTKSLFTLNLYYVFFVYCKWGAWKGAHVWHDVCGSRRITQRNQLSPSTWWGLGIRCSLSDLVPVAFIHRAEGPFIHRAIWMAPFRVFVVSVCYQISLTIHSARDWSNLELKTILAYTVRSSLKNKTTKHEKENKQTNKKPKVFICTCISLSQ